VLTSLRVRDLAVLEDVQVSLGEGLTVLTGETGAGKSLVVDAVSLLAGERADASLVRSGAERLVVEGAFECQDARVLAALQEAGLAEDGAASGSSGSSFSVIVRREVAPGGKGRLFIDGSPASLKTLTEIAPRLLVLYGQAEARDLLDPSAPRELVDRFAALEVLSEKTAELHREWKLRDEDRNRIAGAGHDRVRRLEHLDFQIQEIDAVEPKPGEEEAIGAEKAVLSNVERVGQLLSDVSAALESEDGSVLTALAVARRAFQSLAEIDPAYAARVQEMTELLERASDTALTVSREVERLEADPARLAALAERLDALAKLKRKYGGTLEDVLAQREQIGRERDELADLEAALARAESAARAAFEEYRKSALALSAARAAAAPRLGKAVEAHLKDLAFLKASFAIELSRRAEAAGLFEAGGESVAFGPHGIDQVTFTFAPNPGEPPRSLARIASGGELSRVQLALAAAMADEEIRMEGKPPVKGERARAPRADRKTSALRTFIFDEVDAGVSGATAEAVGRKLVRLAAREQILVVTHLPQVAAAGERHFSVSKEQAGGRTRTRVTELDEEGRVEAIAAMLAGASVGQAARVQARQLLDGFRRVSALS
jgi:DNA repair protein RecN (Recombination protein N)